MKVMKEENKILFSNGQELDGNAHYVYVMCDPSTKPFHSNLHDFPHTPYYVGKGRGFRALSNKNISKSLKGRPKNNGKKTSEFASNSVYVHNNKTTRRIRKDLLQTFLDDGWNRGRILKEGFSSKGTSIEFEIFGEKYLSQKAASLALGIPIVTLQRYKDGKPFQKKFVEQITQLESKLERELS